MSNEEESRQKSTPVLRLRPTVPTEWLRPGPSLKHPDGPWIPHPGRVDEKIELFNNPEENQISLDDITMSDYRSFWKAGEAKRLERLKDKKLEDIVVGAVISLARRPDMRAIQGHTDHEIALAVERYYVGAHTFGADWGLNARGIYYPYYYSPGWVTADHSLWLPTLNDKDWDDPCEEDRRARARTFVNHVLDNEKWNKSEHAWEADAWTDVFGRMRDDPLLAVDKHEYNTVAQKKHPISCLLTPESKLIKRIPDATFGLATFQPRDYQNCLADWDLDRERLESLALHRHCGLLSDPHWGDASLVFPFAVYEAKGWSGDACEARRQATSAGAVYLDLLDRLTRQPGKLGDKEGTYQTGKSRNSQVFAFTSFGAHWHILVGYKRPRLKREFRGYDGVSDSVYLFQRIWSGRVTTERRAWEFLSFVDQIHLWGVTDFRDFVIQHLKPWHEFGKICYLNDINYMASTPGTSLVYRDDGTELFTPRACTNLPEWTKHLSDENREKLKDTLAGHLIQANSKYRSGTQDSDQAPEIYYRIRMEEDSASSEGPGYPFVSPKAAGAYLREIYGQTDDIIGQVESSLGARRNVRLNTWLPEGSSEDNEQTEGKRRRGTEAEEDAAGERKRRKKE